jgi:parallel beta-helix repeat protein
MQLSLGRLAVLAGVCALFLALAPGSALANHVQCGDVITQSVKLDADLTCEAQGLVVGADGVTVDLNGHTISGQGDPFEETLSGVQADGRSGVVVRNGTITGFTEAVLLTNASQSVVRDITAAGNLDGITVRGDGIVIRNNTVTASFIGISASGDGLVLDRNQAAGEFAISVDGSNLTVTRNHATECSQLSIEVHYQGALISRNLADDRCGTGPQFVLSGTGGRIERNTALNGDTGFAIDDPSGVVTSNVANFNSGDGIEIRSAGTTVTRNTANFNGELGIEAVPGTIDAGGNRARGNGNPAQCVGVTCKR